MLDWLQKLINMSAFLLCFKVLVQYGERWKVLVLGDTFPSVVKKEFDIDSEVTILFLALQWKPCEVGKAISFLSFIYQNPTLMEKVNLGAGIWHSVGAWGWGIWLWLPWKCQIPLGLPAPYPTLGLNIDRCIIRDMLKIHHQAFAAFVLFSRGHSFHLWCF